MTAWLVAALAVFVTPALLFAHARLVRSSPPAGASVASPAELALWFSETPEIRFTHVRLTDSAGTEIPLAAPRAGAAMSIMAGIERPLVPGRYTVEWHTAAADGHSSQGSFSFRVIADSGAATPAAVQTPAQPAVQSTAESNALVHAGNDVTIATPIRWAEFVALLVLIGLAIYRLSISRDARWTPELTRDGRDRALRFARAVLVLFAVATLTRGLAEAQMLGLATSRVSALLTMVRVTRWGFGWGVGAAGVIVTAIGLAVANRGVGGWIVAAAGIVALCASEALTGHSASNAHPALAIAADVAHQLGAGGWLGGLIAVCFCGLPALARLGDAERAAAGSRLLRAYHGAAVECVTIVVASALVAAWLRLPRLDALWTSDYGQRLLLKLSLVIILLLFGFYHWRRVVTPEWAGDTAARFRRTAAAELLVGALVIAVTALLVSTSLPQ